MRNLVPNLIYQATGSEVETVIVDGRVIMDNRQMMTMKQEEIIADAQNAAVSLAKKAEKDFIAAGSILAKMMREGKT
jgi:5-methylthioadenosine/S-adenosylhomocysteine deaminase